jgi:hypothetical protein
VWLGRADRGARQSAGEATRLLRTVLPTIAILGLSAVVAGIVNFERWRNPFTFADFHYYDMRLSVYPYLPEVLQNYGEFDIGRIWIGALYYATDIPYLLHTLPPFAKFLHARFHVIEAPPMTPVLTNPLTVILAGIGLYRVWWRPEPGIRGLAILRLALLGHSSAVFLILAAMGFTLRYRFDFAPFMTLAALVGYASISGAMTGMSESWRKCVRIAAVGLCFLGILIQPLRAALVQSIQLAGPNECPPRPAPFRIVSPNTYSVDNSR